MSEKIMDRQELRFRILFEYYEEIHHDNPDRGNDAYARIRNMDISDNEKNAAQVWLVDSGYVEGENSDSSGSRIPHPFISRINSYGINFVESVMDAAFTQIKDKFEDVTNLSKTERIQRFAKDCLNHPASATICKVTYEAIVNYMSSS